MGTELEQAGVWFLFFWAAEEACSALLNHSKTTPSSNGYLILSNRSP